MNKAIFDLIILMLCCSLSVITISAQQSEQDWKVLSQIKIEYFDWYSQQEVADPTASKSRYLHSLPEGESSNYPPKNSSRQKEPERFVYRVKIRNLSNKLITLVAWRYEFVNPLTKELAASLGFESRVRIKPNKRKTIFAESFSPPTQTIDVNLLLLNKKQPFLESVTVKSLVFREIPKKNWKQKKPIAEMAEFRKRG